MTLARFKRELVMGSRWRCHHLLYDKDMGERPVSVVQTNAVGFLTERGTTSWLYFPLSKDLRYDDETETYIVSVDGEPLLKYKKV